jgi:hypothetical protein
MNQPAKRIEGEAPPTQESKQIVVDPKVFDRYVGRYELTPGFVLTVTRAGNQLFVQATGQGKAEVFPTSERDYFYKVVDAQITFEVDSQGKITGLTLHQAGDHHAKKIE